MRDLTLIGVHDDGEHLILAAPDGQRYVLRIDETLRAAVRQDRARLGQLQLQAEGRLRPREIQARIRAGETAEDVAVSADLPVEHVRRFEGPVLAEREFVARQARGVRIRRPGGGDPTLGDVVSGRLAARQVDDEDATWDAWRRDDGQWVVTLTFVAGSKERVARWTYDAGLRHVAPLDDESRWLTDEEADEPGSPGGPRRLAPVPGGSGRTTSSRQDSTRTDGARPDSGSTSRSQFYDAAADEPPSLTSTGRAPQVTTVAEPDEDVAQRATVDLLETLRARRGQRQPLADQDGDEDDDPLEVLLTRRSTPSPSDDDTARPADVTPTTTAEPRPRPVATPRAERGRPSRSAKPSADRSEPSAASSPTAPQTTVRKPAEVAPPAVDVSQGEARQVTEVDVTEVEVSRVEVSRVEVRHVDEAEDVAAAVGSSKGRPDRSAAAAARKNKRASVPSWDDIMFGGRRE